MNLSNEQVVEWLNSLEHRDEARESCLNLWRSGFLTNDVLTAIFKTMEWELSETEATTLQRELIAPSFESLLIPEVIAIAKHFELCPESLVWHIKDVPDNCLISHILGLPGSYTGEWLEEYGFVVMGDLVLARTIQPAILTGQRVTKGQHSPRTELCVIAIPVQAVNEEFGGFQKWFELTPAIGGGVGYMTMSVVTLFNDEFKHLYGIPRTVNPMHIVGSGKIDGVWRAFDVLEGDEVRTQNGTIIASFQHG